MKSVQNILMDSKTAKSSICNTSLQVRNQILEDMRMQILEDMDDIIAANETDIAYSTGKISVAMIDRLKLDEKRIKGIVSSLSDVISLPDPLHRVLDCYTVENGLQIEKVSVAMGTIAIIYEARPNVTVDAAALCLKAGSCCILKCGSAALQSSIAFVSSMKKALRKNGVDENVIQIVEESGHDSALTIMKANDYVDLLIPRGGKKLIDNCIQNASVPTIQTGTGICHGYVDEFADLDKAVNIIYNAKTSRVSVCNAMEVCLVHEKIASKFLPLLHEKMKQCPHSVELRCDERAYEIIGETKASESDFDTEFLDYILAIKIVDSVEEAITHISAHSTHHSEVIISENADNCLKFVNEIDSAAVYINASTRFTDGGQFGMGCEMGISTQKLHARGPMGLNELCSYKYIVTGNGQIRV